MSENDLNMIDLVLTHLDNCWGPPWWFDTLKSVPVLILAISDMAILGEIDHFQAMAKIETGTDFSASNHQGGHQQLSRWVRTKSFLPNTKCFFKDIKYGPWSTWPTLSRCFLSPLLCQINLELAQITLVLFLIYLQTLHSIACEGTSSGKV